jgi:ATP-dependent Clp protease ATP-binding subunit ClpC
MLERFSDRARHALALANLEAGKLGHNYPAPGHIMLGLIAEGECVATEALRVLDVDLERVREQVKAQMEQGGSGGEDGGGVGRRAQTKETKEVIATAIAEARKFGHRYVGTEHLVLALLGHVESIPSRVLRQQGVQTEKLREKTLALLRSSVDPSHDLAHSRHGDFEWVHQQELSKAFRSPKFWHTMILAVDSANRLGSGEVEPQHLLLALLRDESSGVAGMLREKGVTLDWLREQVSRNHVE